LKEEREAASTPWRQETRPGVSESNRANSPPDEAAEKLLDEDALIVLYKHELAEALKDWRRARAEAGNKNSPEEGLWRERYFKLRDKIEARKAEIWPSIVAQLKQSQDRAQAAKEVPAHEDPERLGTEARKITLP